MASKAKLNDCLPDIVIVQKMHKARLVLAVLKQIRGKDRGPFETNGEFKTEILKDCFELIRL